MARHWIHENSAGRSRVPDAKLVLDTPDIRIYHGLAEDWRGPEQIDFVFTNPYGPLPVSLFRKPMIIHQWVHRKNEAEHWCGNRLDTLIGLWNDGREAFWAANLPDAHPLALAKFKPEPGGWYPEELVWRIFDAHIERGQTVWDGFMGRGTIAKIARYLKSPYVGVEQLAKHIDIAKDYLGLTKLT